MGFDCKDNAYIKAQKDCAGAWPEHNAIQEWAVRHNIYNTTAVKYSDVLKLAEEVTKYRIELQKENKSLKVTLSELVGLDSKQKGSSDLWANLNTYKCGTCRFYVPKDEALGRCRRNAPTMMGYPVVYENDWCGEHKMGTNPSRG